MEHSSFANIDEAESSGILADLLRDNDVFLGGAAMGIGLTKAARFYLSEREKVNKVVVEESFYVVDLGVVVSQVYQWRNYFPRVEPFYGTHTNSHEVCPLNHVLTDFHLISCQMQS